MSSGALPKSLRLKQVQPEPSFEPFEPGSSEDISKNQAPKQSLPRSLRLKGSKKEETPSFEQDEDLDREIERNQAIVTSRMLERLFGTFGNAYQMTPEILKKINPLNALYSRIPNEQKLREFSEKASQGYTKPKTSFEEKVGETAADVASYATAGGGKTILGTAARVLGVPLAGQLAKEGVELAGGDEKTKEYGKLGTMLLLDLWGLKKGVGGGGAKKFGYTSLEEAEKSIPKDALADVTVFENKLNKIEKELRAGVTGVHTSEALRAIDEIKKHIRKTPAPLSKTLSDSSPIQSSKIISLYGDRGSRQKIPTQSSMEAWRFPKIRKDINKLIENMKGFTLEGPPRKIKQAAVDNLNIVKSSLIQAGNRWGRGQSPEFFKKWREGNEALAVFHRSNDIARFISKATKIKNPVLKVITGVHTYQHPVASLGLAAAKKGAEVGTRFPTAMVYRFMKSKVLRKLYTNVLKEAGEGNAGAVASGIAKIEKEMEKEGIK